MFIRRTSCDIVVDFRGCENTKNTKFIKYRMAAIRIHQLGGAGTGDSGAPGKQSLTRRAGGLGQELSHVCCCGNTNRYSSHNNYL